MIRLFKFLVSGGIGVSVNLGIFKLLLIWGVPYLLGSIVALLLSMVVGFLLQKYWTFENRHTEEVYLQFTLYAGLALTNLAINTIIVYILVDKLEVLHLLAQAIGAATVAIYSFFIYRFFIFKSRPEPVKSLDVQNS